MDIVNNWICERYEPSFSNLLLEDNFKEYYNTCTHVIKNKEVLTNVLSRNNVTKRQISKIVNDYFLNLVPTDLRKETIEKEFNNIIRRRIDTESYTFSISKNDCDWYVTNDETGEKLYGFSYPHLFHGEFSQVGLQKLKNNISRDKKTLNVIVNYKNFTDENDKAIPILLDGINKGNICYVNDISECIRRII